MRASTSSPLRFYRLFSAYPAFPPFPFSNLFSPLSTVKSSRLLRMDKTYTGDNPSSSRHRSPFSSSAFSGRSSGRGQRRDFGREGAPVSVNDRIDALGRLLTRILRHNAVELNLEIRSDGYVCVSDLLKLNLATYAKVPLRAHTIEDIKEAVRINNKQRLSLLEENGKLLIRANQGHSIKQVTSESLLKPILSADELQVCVHGTYKKNLNSILQYGLKRMERLHVHFASGLPSDGGLISGMRRDVNILIFLDVRKALKDGMKLYISDNKVILTEGFEGIIPLDYFEKIETWPERAPIVYPLNENL